MMPVDQPIPNEVSTDALCIVCKQLNEADAKMVQCDGCTRWIHFSCAGVGDSIEADDRSYHCVVCRPRGSRAPSTAKSTASTSASARQAKLQLEMQQLAEEKELQAKMVAEKADQDKELQEKAIRMEKERKEKVRADQLKLEKEFMDRKYKLLHAQLNEDARTSSRVSVRSGDTAKSVEKVRCWIDNHQGIMNTKSGKVISTGFIPEAGDDVVPKPVVPVENTVVQSSSSTVPARVNNKTGEASNIVARPSVLAKLFDDVTSPITNVNRETSVSDGNPILSLPSLVQSTPRTAPVSYTSIPIVQRKVSWQNPSAAPQLTPAVTATVVSSSLLPQIPAYSEYIQPRDEKRTWVDSHTGQYNLYVVPTSTMVSTSSSASVRCTGEPIAHSYVQPSYIYTPSLGQLGHSQVPRNEPLLYTGSDNYFISRNQPVGFPNPLVPQNALQAVSHTPSTIWGDPRPPLRAPVVSVSSYQTPIPAVANTQWPYELSHSQSLYGPNTQQLAARHVVPKELPCFAGDPIEWPMFWSSYETSTQMCGYNDSENLMRLQRCLKGDARKSVSSFLLHPSNVPEIINTLRVLYGRPEAIINSLLAEVRATPTPRPDKLGTIISFGLAVRNFCAHLVSTGQQLHLANPILIEELVEKLPANIKLDWAMYKQRVPNVDLKTFADYMNVIVTAASSVTPVSAKLEKPKGKAEIHTMNIQNDEATEKPESYIQTRTARPCVVCHTGGHKPKDCTIFKSKTLEDRWKVAQGLSLCRRCLYPHGKWPCKALGCGVNGCQQRHHRLLHPGEPREPKTEISVPTSGVISVHQQQQQVLFRIIPVVLHANGRSVRTFAFLDGGSDSTLVERSLAEQLGVQGPTSPLCMQWTNGVKRVEEESQQIQLNISGLSIDKQFTIRRVQTIDGLELPRQSLNFEELQSKYPYMKGLPVQSYNEAVPGLLIGLDNTRLKTTLKLREGREHEPVVAKTRLGWVLYGRSGDKTGTSSQRVLHIRTKSRDDELHELVKSFFSMESIGVAVTQTKESADDMRAQKILQSTTIRTETGRFETGLLWRFDNVKFPDSRPMAERRLRCLERRLLKSPDLYDNVRQKMTDYISKGYAHKATTCELDEMDPKRTWFLPLGVVVNPKKPDKIRVVWDAAASIQGVSLNSVLLKGPDLLTSLQGVLCRYRQRKIAISGDIMEMFHQVLIRMQDRTAQWFLWRDSPSDPIEVHVMDVAIFGSTCSPSSTQFVKNLNAREYAAEYPEASQAIQENHYVDDYLDSVDTIEQAVQLALDVKQVHEKAGFVIRHWMSNSAEVLLRIGEQNTKSVKSFTMDKGSNLERVLGMVWRPQEDVFVFSSAFRNDLQRLLEESIVPTKRQLLSLVMSVFDPLGMVAPFVVHGKTIVQDVWRSGIGWDEPLPANIVPQWERYAKLLGTLNTVKIPRCYFPGYQPEAYNSLELHVFVDASNSAYAAAAYFRILDHGEVRCSLVAARSKVAPIKLLSVPRLELQAAVIGTRLMKSIISNHTIRIKRKILWSDSATVLNWIRADPRNYKQFVAFRVTEILDETEISDWRKVPTKMNVADEATKWGQGPCFDEHSRWFNGPEFLYKPESDWPEEAIEQPTTEELRVAYLQQQISTQQVIEFERFSKWERLLRTMAFVLRFVLPQLSQDESKSNEGMFLRKKELQRAESTIFKIIQSCEYPEECRILRSNREAHPEERRQIQKNSRVFKLLPFMDPTGVMRMGSRIAAADCIPDGGKFPVILPKDHYVTQLVINWYHRKYGHANNETVVNELRQKFHVSELRTAVKKVAKCCNWCKIHKCKPQIPPMAPLPLARLTPYVRAFTFTGLDYFGPITVRFGRGVVKRWVALFTCLGTRAVHLELTYSLSSESCKMAIRRFIARRGAPQEIYSDQGTNFQGASAELKQQISTISCDLAETFTNAETQWKLNPPYAPHMGGIWERLIRSVKTGLANMELSRNPDEETLVTALVEVESLVNSRPLTYLPVDSEEGEALTPNHFLLLSSSGVVQPEVRPTEDSALLRSNWKHVQLMLDRFWKRWIQEYLPVISRQPKWFGEVKPINIGDLVIVVNDGVRNSWIRGRIVKVYPGRDGRVRSADVQTSGGIMRRPAIKLATLDVAREAGTA
ncbi:uncharacterized protein LOC129773624 [Toxorhynchites rutilus septentrionalis]|uniref:uncharacterized protein LOC129773624 n=1 Tax=Toxorhynchites rutilus septentrionalis TaxID=329112 RepID=UPI0024795648|nr:uncharacterized protein LOC129773624 [Toxorhynchites rutilus septentrionalis]